MNEDTGTPIKTSLESRAASLKLYASAVEGRADPTHVALWATFTGDTDEKNYNVTKEMASVFIILF